MTVSLKDGLKLVGISIICACAVFVCTFFLSYYLDALSVREKVAEEAIPLYESQLLSSKLTCLISGLCLVLVCVVLLLFYVKLYLDGHAKQIGILKALGYANGKIALGFWVFGLSVLLGCAVGFGGGYAMTPVIYHQMDGKGLPEIPITFHWELFVCFVILPAFLFAALAVLYAYIKLRLPASELLRGKTELAKGKAHIAKKERPFLRELFWETLRTRKALAFFVAFACFCFSAMLQMSVSMMDLASATMGGIVLGIGVLLAVMSLLLAFTAITASNEKTVAVMRANGYTPVQCGGAVLGGYHIPAAVGFAVGTVYQYGILRLMVDLVFKGVEEMKAYSFDVETFFIVLAAFIVLFELAVCAFTYKMGKASIRKLTAE
ncbi:MAG: FtsX-like permease family protein [Clostridia bacterium]|nr:FtsX-like permease family protein [Clostridia bacterium]